MIDIHNHILPGVDDGARDIEESIEMAKIYIENGINQVIATPHYIEDYESTTKIENLEVLEKLKNALDENNLDLKVYPGNEIYITMNIIDYIENGIVSTLNNSRYVLIEFPMMDIPLYTEDLIYELLLKGYVPIISHPERNAKIIEDPNMLYDLLMKGALAQLNLPSLEGRYGDRIKETAEILLRHNMIHFVGTDAHSKDKRSPNVEISLCILKDIVDSKVFNQITYLNGSKVIDDLEIKMDSPVKYRKKKKGFGFSGIFKHIKKG